MKKLLGMLFLLSTGLLARELTLQEAIDLALVNGKSIKTSELSKENANLNVKSAFKDALPNVVYNGTYQKSEYSRKIDGVENLKTGYQQSIGVYQTLFQGGAVIAGVQGAKAYRNIADYSYLAQKRDVRLETIVVYSNIVRLQKDLTVYESSKKELQARYDKQKAQLEMRLITKADLLKTEYNILDLESSITATKNQIEIEKKKLKVKLLIPPTEDIQVKEFEVPDDLVQNVNFESDLINAMSNSLSAKIADNKVAAANAKRIVSRADLMPKVEAFAKYGTQEKRNFNDSVDDASWTGGVSVSWKVFEFGKGIDDYDIAKNDQKIEEINQSITTDNIEIQVTNDYLELIRLDKLKISRKKALEAAQENFMMDSERYNAGLISTVDYLISETQVRQAAVDYNAVTIEYLVAFERYRSALI